MAEVSLAGVSKIFEGGVRAVDRVDLSVPDRSFTVLVGPSGCGKSTLLRMIAGLEDISEGEMRIDGARVNETPPRDRDIAMVFQNYALYPHMTVYDNMAFSLKMRRESRSEIAARVHEAAEMLGLEKLLDRRPKALSGGQRQRVAVGRAIVRQPKVFLFDEPLSNLDAKMRVQTRAELVRLHRRLNATMIYVTHDQAEAMTMGDQIVVLRDGRVQQIAPPLSVYDSPANAFVAGFIGSPPMNLLPCRLVARGDSFRLACTSEGGVAFETDLWDSARRAVGSFEDGRPVLLGIRPEDVRVSTPADGSPFVSVEASVDLVEQLGAEQFVTFRLGSSPMVARLQPDVAVRPDDRITFHLCLSKAGFFDQTTEEAIGPR
ncbi:MAG: sn-glycerol-3-phosphate ABC transporter ATP-binding protein UgpC [Acidobacteria bacterium]|nr:sn-glycerol-3-phosphate ABC transporter ATP-binding protein UgpC [Acidobacteriota bacterium]